MDTIEKIQEVRSLRYEIALREVPGGLVVRVRSSLKKPRVGFWRELWNFFASGLPRGTWFDSISIQ